MSPAPSLARRVTAEAVGTAFLLAAVVGSGIMGERLAGGNTAVALLANTLATAGGLYVLIEVFGPVSGAHFNPAVSLVTASTSFANPAATFGRMFSDTFAGIAPSSVPGFIVAELVGAGIGAGIHAVLSPRV